MAHQDPVTGHTVLDPCDFQPQGCTAASAAASQAAQASSAVATLQSTLLPSGASYVPVPAGYPLLIAPYITVDGRLNIPQGQGIMTDDQIGWLMVALQNAINAGPPPNSSNAIALKNAGILKPYNINFVDYNAQGNIDNSGAQIIKSATQPLYFTFHKGQMMNARGPSGMPNDGYPNYDFFQFPAIYSNIKQPGFGVMDAITTVIGAVAPLAGVAAGAADKATKTGAASGVGFNDSAAIASTNIPTTTGSTSANPLNAIANSTGLSTTVIIGLLLLILVLGYLLFKK